MLFSNSPQPLSMWSFCIEYKFSFISKVELVIIITNLLWTRDTKKERNSLFCRYDHRQIILASFLYFAFYCPQYIVERHGKTLLPQYLGVYRITVDNKETYLLVMKSVFSSRFKIHKKYDLKGSTVDRQASSKEKVNYLTSVTIITIATWQQLKEQCYFWVALRNWTHCLCITCQMLCWATGTPGWLHSSYTKCPASTVGSTMWYDLILVA